MTRSRLVPVLAAALLCASVLPFASNPAGAAEEPDPSVVGAFGSPFREDGAPYDGSTNTFGGSRGDTGCTEADSEGRKDCLPAAASNNLLADGRLLYWNAIEGSEDLTGPIAAQGGDTIRNDRSRLLSLGQSPQWAVPGNETGYFPGSPAEPPLLPIGSTDNPATTAPNDGSLFCSDQEQLADGTILAAGGTNYYAEPRLNEDLGVVELEGIKNTRVFDPATSAWRPSGSMKYGRWYPSLVTLPGGNVFVASGVTKLMKPIYRDKEPSESGDNVRQTETYDLAAGTWSDNGAAAQRSLPLFPRLHLLPNGKVYYGAAGQSFNPMGQSYSEALWNIAATYDPASKAWSDLGVPGLGVATEPGFRGSTFQQMLPLKAPYSSASFITAGGVLGMSPGSYLPTRSTRIDRVTVSGDDETLDSFAAGPLNRPRWYSSAVTLPTGQVLAFSGADVDEVVSPGSESPIRQVEMFTPNADGTGGTWKDVAVASRKRTYHNSATLLPDGSILVGGHAPIPNGYGYVQNNPDVAPDLRPASNNFKDASFEIYYPPYFFQGDRPVISEVDDDLAYNSVTEIETPDAADVTSVVLVRNPSVTHLIDGDQRVVELEIASRDNDGLAVRIPGNTVLPEGPYQLFVNRAGTDGLVPSVAEQVFVGVEAPEWADGADEDETAPVVTRSSSPVGSGGAPALPLAAPASSQPAALPESLLASRRSRTPLTTTGLVALGALLMAAGAAGAAATRRSRRTMAG